MRPRRNQRRVAVGIAIAVLAAVGCEDERRDRRGPLEQVEGPALTPRSQAGKRRAKPAAAPPANDAGKRAVTQPTFTPVSGVGFRGFVHSGIGERNWTPGEDDIAAMEARLPAAFAAAVARGDVPEGVALASYVRQYRGSNVRGARAIRTMFICPESAHLASRMFQVRGGYTCFVHVNYTLETETFSGWRVNSKR